MQQGQLPIYEPGLEQLFNRNISQNRLQFTTNLAEAIAEAKIIFLALPTPPGRRWLGRPELCIGRRKRYCRFNNRI